MNVLSKFNFETTKFLDLQAGEYNLGVVPNMIIDKFIHEISFVQVTKQLVGRYEHKKNMKIVLEEMISYDEIENFEDNFFEEHNRFVEEFGTFEENPEAYAFYNDFVYGV
jgi:hypothetical protein